MASVIGYGNSIMFREVNGLLPSFDNTFLQDEDFINTMTYNKCQEYFAGDVLVIQAKVDTGDVPTMAFYDSNGLSGAVSGTLKSSYDDYDFYEFSKTLSAAGTQYYLVFKNTGDNDWQSEPIKVVESDSSYLLLQWFNSDATTGRANNNFEMDYSTDIVPYMRIKAMFKDYEPASEISVYENLDEVVKLKEKIKRTIKIVSDSVPRYMAEKLVVATAHDNFYVNQVSFIREEKPEIENLESNLSSFSAVLTQQNVIGLNTFDIGFDCDEIVGTCKITNLEETGVSTNTTFTVPEGYLLQTITAYHRGGGVTTTMLKFGTTVGDDDIGTISLSNTEFGRVRTLTKNIDYAPTGDATLYCDVSGTGADADIYIILIDNRQ